MANKFKALISGIVTAAIAATLAPATLAAQLPEAIIENQTEITDLNKTYETNVDGGTKGVADADSIDYTAVAMPYVIEFDITVNTPLRAGTTSKGNRDAFGIGFTQSNNWDTRGGFFVTTASNDSNVAFTWITGDGSGSNQVAFGTYNIGETYKMKFFFETGGVYFASYDLDGNQVTAKTSALPTRNGTGASAMSKITISQNARETGTTDSVTIDNAVMYTLGPDSIDLGYNGTSLSSTDENNIIYDGSSLYALTASVSVNGAALSGYDVTTELVDAPEVFGITSSGITVDSSIEPGVYNFSVKASLTDYPEAAIEFPISFIVNELEPEEVIEKALANILIDTKQAGISLQADGTYRVIDNFELPVYNGKASITGWLLEEQTEDGSWINAQYASIIDNKVTYKKETAPKDYTLRLTVNIEYVYKNDAGNEEKLEASKSVELYAPDIQTIRFYEEDFDDMVTGEIVGLDIADSEKPVIYADKGMTFNSGTRSTGGSTENSISVVAGEGSNKYLQINLTQYFDASNYSVPTITFTRKNSDRSYSYVIRADLMFGSSAGVLYLIDSSNNSIEIDAPSTLNKWLTYEMYIGTNTTSLFIYDQATGKAIDYQILDETVKNLKTITVPNAAVGAISIDNLQVLDTKYSVDYATVQQLAYDKLIIDDSQSALTLENGVYNAANDFTVPKASDGTTLSWKAYQRPVGGEAPAQGDSEEAGDGWTASSFITVSGTNAVINPTSDIDNYDVKLVGTIDANGQEPRTKEFSFNLPNPLDEIAGVLASGYEKVKAADDSSILYDLNGTELLKYDLNLPLKVSGYNNTTIAWTSSDEDHLSIGEDGVAKIMTSDFDAHSVTLTAVATYSKNGITYTSEEQTFTINVGFEASDAASTDPMLDKYKVRYDAAYAANFSSIPSSASANITLPATGKFGSAFSWNSSVPTVISNLGKYTKPASTKSVVMTATIISGAASQEKPFTIIVPGSSSSSGGGGSTSSTGTTSSSKSSGSVATSTTTAVAGSTGVNGEEVIEKLLEEAAQANDAFTDISSAVWAREAINGLAAAGIINGKSETEFAPNDTVTRAEFAKMLMGVFGLNSDAFTTSSFRDVSTGAWYFQAVETAYNLGIITGIEDGVFAPDALITRQDMAVMVSRAAAVAGKDIPETVEAKSFNDAASISSYAVNAVDQLVKGGIINGMSDTEFAPLSNATRAQAAKILYSFL